MSTDEPKNDPGLKFTDPLQVRGSGPPLVVYGPLPVISLNYRDAIFYIVLAAVNSRLRLSKFAVVLSAVRQTNMN